MTAASPSRRSANGIGPARSDNASDAIAPCAAEVSLSSRSSAGGPLKVQSNCRSVLSLPVNLTLPVTARSSLTWGRAAAGAEGAVAGPTGVTLGGPHAATKRHVRRAAAPTAHRRRITRIARTALAFAHRRLPGERRPVRRSRRRLFLVGFLFDFFLRVVRRLFRRIGGF